MSLFISRDRVCNCIVENHLKDHSLYLWGWSMWMFCRKTPRAPQTLFISRIRACECIIEWHLEDHKLYLSLGIEHVSVL